MALAEETTLKFKMPKSFELFGSTITVEFDNKECGEKEVYEFADELNYL